MGCICNNLVWRSLVNVPPDVTPPSASLYMYALVIEGYLYDPVNDTYDGITVNGVLYNGSGGSLLSDDNGGNTATALGTDYASALPDQVGNGYGYRGFQDASAFAFPYFFLFVTSEAQTISVNVTLNGVPTVIPVTGGAVTMINRCLDITTANPAVDVLDGYEVFVPNQSGASYTLVYSFGGSPLDNPQITDFDLYFNTTNVLIPTSLQYTNNGDGTITLTYRYPSSPCTLSRANTSVGYVNYTNC